MMDNDDYAPSLKAKLALAAIERQMNVDVLSEQYGIEPETIRGWADQLRRHAVKIFIPFASGTGILHPGSVLLSPEEREYLTRM